MEEIKNQLTSRLKRQPEVLAVYFIGSEVKGKARKDSDFDLAVVVDQKKPPAESKYYELIRDINFPKDIDLSVVDKKSSPLFLFQIISTGRRVYCRTEMDAAEFEAFTLHNFYDTQHIRNIYYQHLHQKFPYAD